MEKTEIELAKKFLSDYGFSPNKPKELAESARAVQEFVQYVGTNQYYSDALNKKIFLLGVDLDACILKIEQFGLETASLRDAVMRNVLLKKKEKLDSAGAKEVRNRLTALEQELLALQRDAVDLTAEIRKEYKSKQGC